jgi:hypothetical protein
MHPNVISVGATEIILSKAIINPRVDFIFYNNTLTTTDTQGGYAGTINYSSPYTALISALCATILSAEQHGNYTGTQKTNWIKTRINSICSSINNYAPSNNSKYIIYNIK